MEQSKQKGLELSYKHPNMMGKYPPAYLADRTYAFTFSTHAFAGIGAQLPVFAVGTLAAIHSVVTADTLTARDPLRGRREAVNGIANNHVCKSIQAPKYNIHYLGLMWNLQP